MSDDPPELVMNSDPCVELADRARYLAACERYEQTPEPHPDPCDETRLRIRLSLAAWAYEMYNDPIMSDAEFDALARRVDVNRSTARSDLDAFFVGNFNADTGVWIHRHPELDKLDALYRRLYRKPVEPPILRIMRHLLGLRT